MTLERVGRPRRVSAPGARKREGENESSGNKQSRRAARLPSATHGR